MAQHDTMETKVRRLKRVIETQYAMHWTAKTLADAAGLSVLQMRRNYQAHFGTTALDHLRDVRVRAAADRLVAGTTVSETAAACGFTTCGHLSRVFFQSTGIFPSHYRFKMVGWKYAPAPAPRALAKPAPARSAVHA